MNSDEFAVWLSDLVDGGDLEPSAADELVEARLVFDRRRSELLTNTPSRVVGIARGEVLGAESVPELLAMARSMEALVYFERTDEELPSFDDLERRG